MNLFNFIGHLFLSQAENAGATLIQDESKKVQTEIDNAHDQIALAISPLVQQVPEADRQQLITNLTEVAKQAAVAYAEAYIDSKIPKVPPVVQG